MSRSILVGAALPLVLLALVLASCSPPATPTTPAVSATPTVPAKAGRGNGGTLKILYWQAPTILNPHLTTGAKDWAASRVTYEPLASYDKDGTLIPFLAQEIPSLTNGGVAADGRSVTWKLRRDVKWSDGQPFTAKDVLFTYQFISDSTSGATTTASYDAVKNVEAPDDYTVKVNFKDVNPAWSLPFVGTMGMILPEHAFEGYVGAKRRDAPVNQMPIGTGPYRVTQFKTQEVLFLGSQLIETNIIVFEPNPFFREPDKPFFGRVEVRGGGTVDEAAREVLQTGDVDFAYNLQLDAETLDKLQVEGQGHLLSSFGFFVERIAMNQTDPNRTTEDGERSSVKFPHFFLTNKTVRQAFDLAIDRQAIAKLYGATGRLTTNILVSPATYQSQNTKYAYDPGKAATLLEQEGWRDANGDGVREKDGVKLSVAFQTAVNPVRQQTQDIVKKNLEAIGVEVSLKIIDSSIFFGSDQTNPNTRLRFSADMEEYQTGNRSPDPGAYMKWWTCDEIVQKANNWSGNNVERWCNPAYDALYKQSTTEMDPAKRRLMFIQMNDMVVNELIEIPLIHRADVAGVNDTLEGVEFTPWDAELWNIKDWRRKSQ